MAVLQKKSKELSATCINNRAALSYCLPAHLHPYTYPVFRGLALSLKLTVKRVIHCITDELNPKIPKRSIYTNHC